MRLTKRRVQILSRWVLLCALLGVNVQAHAHGSVTADADLCIIQIGFYSAHFTIHQPRSSPHEEFCEDLPDTGETVFVMDYLHKSLRDVPVEFRVVRDTGNLGRFARVEDLPAMNFERDTVFHQTPVTEPDAVFTTMHTFIEPGDYIGIVSAGHPSKDLSYDAVFAFQVGGLNWIDVALLGSGACLLVVILLLGWRWRSQRAATAF